MFRKRVGDYYLGRTLGEVRHDTIAASEEKSNERRKSAREV